MGKETTIYPLVRFLDFGKKVFSVAGHLGCGQPP